MTAGSGKYASDRKSPIMSACARRHSRNKNRLRSAGGTDRSLLNFPVLFFGCVLLRFSSFCDIIKQQGTYKNPFERNAPATPDTSSAQLPHFLFSSGFRGTQECGLTGIAGIYRSNPLTV